MLRKFHPTTLFILGLIAIFFALGLHYNFGMQGYQQFVYLAESFLQGKLYFLANYDSWWHDAVLFEGNYYWPLGPFPAVSLMPFVWFWGIFGQTLKQGNIQIFLVLLVFALIYKLARVLKYGFEDGLYLGFAFCFASVFLGVAFWPNSWFFAQVVATVLLLLSLVEFYGKRRFWLIGIILGLLLLTRLPASLGILFFGLSVLFSKTTKQTKLLNLLELGLPFLVAGLLLGGYNYARFGDFFEQGYGMQITAGAFSASMKNHLFGLEHVPGNLYYLFLSTPTAVLPGNGTHILATPFIKADPWGMSIFLSSPYLLLTFALKYKDFQSRALLLTALVISIPIITYYGIGWYQFGYRYSLDFLPFLFLLFMIGYKQLNEKLSIRIKTLFVLGALFNLYLFKDLFLL